MRIRTIKPEFFNHEAIYEAELESGLPLRLSFIGLWCAADREGRFKWQPRRLGIQILPYDKADFSRVLDALATRGFVIKYSSEDGEFGYIPSFPKHQVINNRERDSELPNPNDCNTFDASATREPHVDHACKAEGKGRERKGGEGDIPSPPSFDSVKSFADSQMMLIPESCLESFYDEMEALQWTYKGQPCIETRAWQGRFRKYVTHWINNSNSPNKYSK